ncbi:hypothetical protein ILUMI_24341 [Ignelater luminosus]|uniref:Caspase family p20 domain-containing protein n=1 Tax=Ignelater luminosus TaxID=2038154 RepID=A0A8K0C6G2_IGNLU|nr:hypothetical protein ILUMI_24341 [Ignelater luminosus]
MTSFVNIINKMIEPAERAFTSSEKPRKYSAVHNFDQDDIEKIKVLTSTELIPDEYEHEDNTKGLVFIFHCSRDEENKKVLTKAFSDQGYNVSLENIYRMSTKEFVINTIKKIAEKNHTDETCLIVVFLGNVFQENRILPDDEKAPNINNTISIKDVWTPFTSDNCPSLKYKPKVFIFQTCKKPELTSVDNRMVTYSVSIDKAYDIPAEADILIIYKKVEDVNARHKFIEQLCNNFHYEGCKDDIVGLVTHTEHGNERRPLIISTLTRKFYIRPSEKLGHRGHGYDLHVNHDIVFDALQDLQEKITTIQEQQEMSKKHIEQRSKSCSDNASTNASPSCSGRDDRAWIAEIVMRHSYVPTEVLFVVTITSGEGRGVSHGAVVVAGDVL